ncbi:uncharacterized protein LOC134152752 [Rhea pennata]|uniref:uncharacterized protein LOC134152752 n=1 Tax=Rhea pennata TaxID=8795 RepID=UPI002E26386A
MGGGHHGCQHPAPRKPAALRAPPRRTPTSPWTPRVLRRPSCGPPEPPALAKNRGSGGAQNHSASRQEVQSLPPSCPRSRWVVATTMALGISVVLNVLLLTLYLRPSTNETAAAAEEPTRASRSLTLYNEAHGKCAEARGQRLTAAPCRPDAPEQRFRWAPVRAAAERDRRGAVRDRDPSAQHGPRGARAVRGGRQPAEAGRCRAGGLLALAGHELYFNYG